MLWGVFDGHRGSDVSGFAAKAMPGLVWDSPLWPASPAQALRSALCSCHEAAREEDLRGGSTAVVVAVCHGILWCCSAGDSRAVAGLKHGGVRRLSMDHQHLSSCPEEAARVTAAGGEIFCGRLAGCLPMTRGLGNFRLEDAGFSCLPDVTSTPCEEAEFVVLASDGLWDVMDDEACCARVRSVLAGGHSTSSSIAEYLAAEARRLGSGDDIAVVFARLSPDPGGVAHGGA
eukprot:TRINITY_DN52757_c0_g1_i10.p1 TRINITY_DN52757_c0_g1~~TRINITY_DN52757_c0_g1_i10.p1  ORF type:complete len:231 (-),score=36.96 TRINITY_DN52757_c0_g1_i10:176-868(-)